MLKERGKGFGAKNCGKDDEKMNAALKALGLRQSARKEERGKDHS